ncbi:MAG TPA: VOC family protein [Solirubrobacteraceae bacterium]|nr:VOC family protein [Solirubrobacteraceae bacterium]
MTAAATERMPSLPAASAIGTVHLTAASLERARAFYERVIGLSSAEQPDGSLLLGGAAGSSPPLLALAGDSAASPRDPRETGLFHLAILLPTRRDLAVALVRLAQAGWRLDGASDHLVSEALYLTDPEGNGIELYHDRSRSSWRRDADGQLAMATLPLDLDDLLGELEAAPLDARADALMPADTRIGHVHLQVAELDRIERFYAVVLGFDVMVRGYPGALFVAAGGYHHHIGLNTWNSRGGSRPSPGSVGLRAYEVRLGDVDAVEQALARLEAAGIATEVGPGGTTMVRDPSGNGVLLTV